MDDTLGVRRGERDTLEGALDWYRAIVERKVEDLSPDQATRIMTPSGLSPLGVVKHLALVERWWFREVFAGETLAQDDDPDGFSIATQDTVDSVVASYRDATKRSRAIADGVSLETLSVAASQYREHVSLRWIMVHMLEETARHAGHLDLMREEIDGRTGD